MKKKNICLIIVAILFVIMLIPNVAERNDGGTKEYNAFLYSVTKYHKLNPESINGYDDGWNIKIVGITVYDKINTYIDAENNNDAIVSMFVIDGTLTKDEVTVVIKNNTDDDYTYGPDFYLEEDNNGSWISTSTITGDPLSWNSIAYKLKAKESIELKINFKSTYGELTDGKYRIIKNVSKDDDIPLTEDKIIKLAVEFEVK